MVKNLFTIFIALYSFDASAQIQVRDEPRHHNVFENESIRILDVYLPPKDTTLYHLHNTASVFIILANTNVSSQLMGKEPQKGANIAGIVSYDSMNIPRLHRVWNEDTAWFHVMDIELTGTKHEKNIPVIQDLIIKLLFNELQVNGYTINMKTGNTLELPASASGYLIISQTTSVIDYKINGISQHRILKPSHYIWVEPGRNFYLKANDTGNFVLLQLK